MGFIPVDARWYIADLVVEHTIAGDDRNVVHINRHLVEAASPDQAYDKAMALGRDGEMEYPNTDGQPVSIVFRGLRDLSVIYDDLEDGAELEYRESIGVEETELRDWLTPREELTVFAPIENREGIPNYFPESVMRELEEAGFQRDDVLGPLGPDAVADAGIE